MSATYELSYGGVPLEVPTDAVRQLICRYNFDLQYPFLRRMQHAEYSSGFSGHRIAMANAQDDPDFIAGRFFYPSDASRWSWYIGVVSQSNLNSIQSQLTGESPVSLPFVMQADDITHPDNSGGVTTNMFMLPPKPLGVTNSTLPREPLYLIVLVDERYLWQWNNCGFVDTTVLASWTSFLTAVTAALLNSSNTPGITVSNAAFEAAYLAPEPDSDLFTHHENAAILLDAIAFNTGRVLVRSYGGFYSFVKPAESALQETNNRPPFPRYRAFGGNIYDPQETGNVQPWINAALPSKVAVTFPQFNNDIGTYIDSRPSNYFVKDSYGAVNVINCPLSTLGAPYDQYIGVADTTKVISDTCKAIYQTVAGVLQLTNLTTLQALATQLAQDYYDQQIAALDEAYTGIRDWTPEGLNDLIFDYMPPKLVQTRAFRKPWTYQVFEMQHHVPSNGTGTVTITIVTNVCPIVLP